MKHGTVKQLLSELFISNWHALIFIVLIIRESGILASSHGVRCETSGWQFRARYFLHKHCAQCKTYFEEQYVLQNICTHVKSLQNHFFANLCDIFFPAVWYFATIRCETSDDNSGLICTSSVHSAKHYKTLQEILQNIWTDVTCARKIAWYRKRMWYFLAAVQYIEATRCERPVWDIFAQGSACRVQSIVLCILHTVQGQWMGALHLLSTFL